MQGEGNKMAFRTDHPVFSNGIGCFGILVNLMWAILFTVYLGAVDYDSNKCGSVIGWNKAVMIFCYIIAGLEVFRVILNCCIKEEDSNIKKSMFNYKTGGAFIGGLIILIGVTATFKADNDSEFCYALNKLNLAFVITEWVCIGLGCCCSCCIVGLGACGVLILNAAEEQEKEDEERRNNQAIIAANVRTEERKVNEPVRHQQEMNTVGEKHVVENEEATKKAEEHNTNTNVMIRVDLGGNEAGPAAHVNINMDPK